jgi:sigma-B regulation protein RsbU (phosphoserine phosphatase)
MKDENIRAATHYEPSSAEHLRLAAEACKVGMWELHAADLSIQWDAQMRDLCGVNEGACGGKLSDFLNLIHEDDRSRIETALNESLRSNAPFNGEFRIIRPVDGGTRTLRTNWVRSVQNDATRLLGVSLSAGDIDEDDTGPVTKRLMFATLMDSLPDNIYFKDRNSRFLAVNRATAQWFGIHDPKEMIGKTDFDLFSDEHAVRAIEDERYILETGQPIVNLEEKETWADGHHTWVSTTKMPLRSADGRLIGTFGLSRNITDRKRSEERMVALNEELRLRKEALERDLDMARELQHAMLPHQPAGSPNYAAFGHNALRLHHFYQASMAVSGDFFDIQQISNSATGLLICDVMGHGVRAALVAATIRALTGGLRKSFANPGEFLSKLNSALRNTIEQSDTPLFASAFYVVADLAKSELRYANAGHPAPLHIRHNGHGQTASPLANNQPQAALGLFDEIKYTTTSSPLLPHDVVLLFTDGLFEVENASGEIYDYDLLRNAVTKCGDLPPEELSRKIIEQVQNFAGGREFNDDACLVAMQIAEV